MQGGGVQHWHIGRCHQDGAGEILRQGGQTAHHSMAGAVLFFLHGSEDGAVEFFGNIRHRLLHTFPLVTRHHHNMVWRDASGRVDRMRQHGAAT